MAIIKLLSTKNANKLINYCVKRAQERDGFNCDPEFAKEQLRRTREDWEKNDSIQAHHVIQSFVPGEVTAQQANDIGRQLAERIAPGHEVLIYTHTDKAHIHNHIVINAVSFETGQKYHSDRTHLYAIREHSNELCRKQGLAFLKEQATAKERFTQAEYKLVDRGELLWKDELRTAVEKGVSQTSSLLELQRYLKQQYEIEMKIQNKNVSFLHPEKQKYVRGKTLGAAYTKEGIEDVYAKQKAGRTTDERIGRDDRKSSERGSSTASPAGAGRRTDSHRLEFGDERAAALGPETADRRRGALQPDRAEAGGQRTGEARAAEAHGSGRTRTDEAGRRTGPDDSKTPNRQAAAADAGIAGSKPSQAGADTRISGNDDSGESAALTPVGQNRDSEPLQPDRGHSGLSFADAGSALDALIKAGEAVQREAEQQKRQQEKRKARQQKRSSQERER
ncbi:relaxase/mobilization nuclease domain-containing protein [Paenibacillus sp. Soil522]|uniref:relaxase/mobilization nuclease domain-containing protein n=1 Tax=Paenibacillus sp. Soil522 TaxID=1736388 RepID=UPI0006FD32DF|nr:relaxase/mobilization nuclease domain-containing protein [Paenibacillus sp. Soil522]KRE35623.1 hypothetical protein ASG81_20475 [Paenibacillus sp. Soil522]